MKRDKINYAISINLFCSFKQNKDNAVIIMVGSFIFLRILFGNILDESSVHTSNCSEWVFSESTSSVAY